MKIVIAAGTGFIGKALLERLSPSHEIIVLTRQQLPSTPTRQFVQWDGKNPGPWQSHLNNADLLINLTGKSVNCRYTKANKAEIMHSRLNAVHILGKSIQQCTHPPKVFINIASATIYRHSLDRPMTEDSHEIHNDFSVQVCKVWEAAFDQLALPNTRKVQFRTSAVFGKQGGVLAYYLQLAKWGLGGCHGNGQQMVSWLHVDDLVDLMLWAYKNPQVTGTYNATAPNPVSNKVMMQSIRRATGHAFGMPMSKWMLQMGAGLIGTEVELLLKSRWVLPAKAEREGFQFKFTHVDALFADLVSQVPRNQYHLF
ncbi:hypothetical protein LX64_00421 [Chitinophaga skermanii]|uniref:DUF1731 domain-containing protein n=1 Tax=Chitinophaga skermanii TaxID=331697 RepID=A0A327R4Y4_9BACT|nr:TIGR01777 family oxidoreductase [Chitinophaga skermanii]RAJ10814.1 hypothetical protein LX64_00421 [Chitinophaga skermanii]